MNPKVDAFLVDGCGRCPLGGTPDCKVNGWQKELKKLRAIALDCGLTEEVKWGFPCYTFQNSNVIMIGAFKDCCTLSFFKGALLKDPAGILEMPGENSQAGRVIRFRTVREMVKLESAVKACIREAIAVEKAGLKVKLKDISEREVPEELQNKMKEHPVFEQAFNALTPGRQRGYLIYFAAPKQSQTRTTRIEKCMPQILAGKGMHD